MLASCILYPVFCNLFTDPGIFLKFDTLSYELKSYPFPTLPGPTEGQPFWVCVCGGGRGGDLLDALSLCEIALTQQTDRALADSHCMDHEVREGPGGDCRIAASVQAMWTQVVGNPQQSELSTVLSRDVEMLVLLSNS